jgi:uncharacterized protein (TIGR02421 family)
MNTQLKKLDLELAALVENLDILETIAPVNLKEEREAFFESHYSVSPSFVYRDTQFNSFNMKRALFNLPIEDLPDEDLHTLYRDVITSYVNKLDQVVAVGSQDFLYSSLSYFGEPTKKDLRNARFILHLPDSSDNDGKKHNAGEIAEVLANFAEAEQLQHSIAFSDSMIANALVSGTTIKINSAAQIPEREVQALAHHEIGVHLVTTLNAREQDLKILSLGCPINTTTQEGLAILCEYLSGNLSLPRLKVLALRVLAVQSMLNQGDFRETFLLLKEEFNTPDEQAFTITARVFRGGGFTKDYLYLQGLHQMLNAYETCSDFENLLSGKVAFEYLPVISRLIEKGYLIKPRYISPAIRNPAKIEPVNAYIAHAIK